MRPDDPSEVEGDETEDRPPSLPAEAELKLFGHTPAYPGGLEIVDPDEDEEEDEADRGLAPDGPDHGRLRQHRPEAPRRLGRDL